MIILIEPTQHHEIAFVKDLLLHGQKLFHIGSATQKDRIYGRYFDSESLCQAAIDAGFRIAYSQVAFVNIM